MNHPKLAAHLSGAIAVALFGAGATAANADPVHAPDHKSGNAVAECAQIAALIGDDFAFQYALKIDPPLDGTYEAEFDDDGDGVIDHVNAITIGGVAASGGQRFNFSATQPIGAVNVKGGNNGANYYLFDPQASAANNLKAPLNNNRKQTQPNVSHMTFCWNPEPNGDCGRWEHETAWSDGGFYSRVKGQKGGGSWAMYTPFDGTTVEPTLFAGQHLAAGKVRFDQENGQVEITITLNEGWRFAPTEENLKIQDYAEAPSGNPAIGKFEHKYHAAGTSFSVTVPYGAFYGVHVDVEEWRAAECPVE